MDRAVGVVDTQPGNSRLAPTSDECMRGREDLRILDAQPRECGDRKESAVVDFAVAARVVDELVVLPVMHHIGVLAFGPAPGARKAVFEVAQLAIDYRQPRIITQDRYDDSTPAPVDVEPRGVRGVRAEPQHVPPGWILDRMRNAEMVRHDVDDHAEPCRPGTDHEPPKRLRTAPVLIDPEDIGGVVTMIRTGRRLQYR